MTPARIKNCFAAIGLAFVLAAIAANARGALPDPVRFGVTIESGDLRSARAWLDEGLDPNFLADRIGTGLMIAAWEGNIPMMALFVGRGAALDAMNHYREQALMHAAWKGRLQAVQWLLDHGAAINRSGREWSALHYAAFNGHEDIARLLMDRGAAADALSTNGSTPLMMAAREGHEGLARLLLARGASTSIKNDWGDDVLVWSMRYGNVRIAKLVATPEAFAHAAQQPRESFGAAVRSASAPSTLDSLIERMRIARSRGPIPPELEQAYLVAVKALRVQANTASVGGTANAEMPQALEIRARRAAPGQEQAILLFGTPPAREVVKPATAGADAPVQR